MSENIQSYINYIADPRARRSIRALFTHFMNDDVSRTFKPITFGVSSGTAITLGGTLTTGIVIGACTTGLSITGASTTALSVTGNATDVLKTLTGTFTDVIDIGGTVTNAVNFTAAATVTNVFKFNAVAGCVVANALVPAAAPDGTTMGADAALVCDINGTPYYIPLYDTLHA